MNVSARLARGKADPFGLLVLAVMLALLITVGIQAQASQAGKPDREVPQTICVSPCVEVEGLY